MPSIAVWPVVVFGVCVMGSVWVWFGVGWCGLVWGGGVWFGWWGLVWVVWVGCGGYVGVQFLGYVGVQLLGCREGEVGDVVACKWGWVWLWEVLGLGWEVSWWLASGGPKDNPSPTQRATPPLPLALTQYPSQSPTQSPTPPTQSPTLSPIQSPHQSTPLIDYKVL